MTCTNVKYENLSAKLLRLQIRKILINALKHKCYPCGPTVYEFLSADDDEDICLETIHILAATSKQIDNWKTNMPLQCILSDNDKLIVMGEIICNVCWEFGLPRLLVDVWRMYCVGMEPLLVLHGCDHITSLLKIKNIVSKKQCHLLGTIDWWNEDKNASYRTMLNTIFIQKGWKVSYSNSLVAMTPEGLLCLQKPSVSLNEIDDLKRQHANEIAGYQTQLKEKNELLAKLRSLLSVEQTTC